MENLDNTINQTTPKKSKGNTVIVIIILVVILAIILFVRSKKVVAPVGENANSDTTSSISKDLNNINLDTGTDNDLKTVDNNINTL